ncbi:putative Co/Zn/Cd efflux system membrane fusion protein [Methylophaga frappieri]|uniref:Putative Co/Zn/Cd efflux system membrane fusion protein n=1 Tax=Methylophaga frappieri (strain ATCC BAA-2434 / DSM 25690 / JAM7) TaxID=754477 RepID=I1YHI7_METFJ|nr:efflux RND transporter periplasmic adaptor subunit [Methylophaga frappieri]AFJ02380.1 putative Co/Zn/Cd efflux system membrane fusion protein [Methylophaga frappieri]
MLKSRLLPTLCYLITSSFFLVSYAAAEQRPLPEVKVMTPKVEQIIERKEFTGRFEAIEDVALRARVSGYLDAVHFKDGQQVEKGDLLFEIDPRPFKAALARAEAELSRVQSQLKLAQLELERGERLLTQKAIAAEEVDTRRARYQEANANVAASQAAVQTAALDLQYTKIVAPVTGRISSRQIDVGNLVSTEGSATPLTTIVTTNPLHFVFDVSEAEYLQLARAAGGEAALNGQTEITAQLRLLDEQGWPREGLLNFVDNRIDEFTGTLRMRVKVENDEGLLRPGIFGRLRMPVSEPHEALLVPDRAVVSDQAAKILLVVNDEGIVEPRPIQPGSLQENSMRVIESGISAEDRVIVQGLMIARPGSEVNAVPFEEGNNGEQN